MSNQTASPAEAEMAGIQPDDSRPPSAPAWESIVSVTEQLQELQSTLRAKAKTRSDVQVVIESGNKLVTTLKQLRKRPTTSATLA